MTHALLHRRKLAGVVSLAVALLATMAAVVTTAGPASADGHGGRGHRPITTSYNSSNNRARSHCLRVHNRRNWGGWYWDGRACVVFRQHHHVAPPVVTVPPTASVATSSTTTSTSTSTTSTSTTTTTAPVSPTAPNCSATTTGTALSQTGWAASSNASSSSADAPANAIDGNLATRFSTDEPQAVNQYFEVNLGSSQTFDELAMNVPNSPTDYARSYVVEVSSNAASWSVVASCTGTGTPEIVSFPAQTAQYVAVVLSAAESPYWWSIDEFDLYHS